MTIDITTSNFVYLTIHNGNRDEERHKIIIHNNSEEFTKECNNTMNSHYTYEGLMKLFTEELKTTINGSVIKIIEYHFSKL